MSRICVNSLTRTAEDIDIIAKIENRSGVEHIEEICEIANGVMIARGDLGVEIPGMEVPAVQKYLISKCGNAWYI